MARALLPYLLPEEIEALKSQLRYEPARIVEEIAYVLAAKRAAWELPNTPGLHLRLRYKAYHLFCTKFLSLWLEKHFGNAEIGRRVLKGFQRVWGIRRFAARRKRIPSAHPSLGKGYFNQNRDLWNACPEDKRMYLLSDLERLPIPVMHYVLSRTRYQIEYKGPEVMWDVYLKTMKEAPKVLYHVKPWIGRTMAFQLFINWQENRLADALTEQGEHGSSVMLAGNMSRNHRYTVENVKKLRYAVQWNIFVRPWDQDDAMMAFDARIEDWRYYCKEILEGQKRSSMSSRHVSEMLQYLRDGRNIFHRYTKDNVLADLKEVKGTLNQQLRAAAYNHHQEHLLRAKEMERKEKRLKALPQPGIPGLPETLEQYRIKTQWDMFVAGKECHQCIGGYHGNNTSLFFRKDNVCAQVRLSDWKVVQCYDAHNKKTRASDAFHQWLQDHCTEFFESRNDLPKCAPAVPRGEYYDPAEDGIPF